MLSNEEAVDIIVEICKALDADNIKLAEKIIRTKYPHRPNEEIPKVKKILSLPTPAVPQLGSTDIDDAYRIKIFMRDGFIDRYLGGRLIFPGTLAVLSATLPKVFPYKDTWLRGDCHQAWKNLGAVVNRIVPPSRGGMYNDNNVVCTAGRNVSVKSDCLPEEIGWKVRPAETSMNWDGKFEWFVDYAEKHEKFFKSKDDLANKKVLDWYAASKKFLNT